MATSAAPSGFGRPIWNAIKGGNQVHGVGLVPVTNTFVGTDATFVRTLFTAPATTDGYFKIEAARLAVMAQVVADNDNHWTIELQVGTLDAAGTSVTWTDLGDLALSTDANGGGANLEPDIPYTLDVDGPETTSPLLTYLAAGDSIRLLATEAGTAPTQVANYWTVTLYLRHSPPGQ